MPTSNARLRYRVALLLLGSVMLLILALVPFAITSTLIDALGVPEGLVFPIPAGAPSSAAANHIDLHASVTAVDELQRVVTLRISGHQTCQGTCPWSSRVLFFSLAQDESLAAGLPPSGTVMLEPTSVEVSQTIQLPARGQPTRYPYDDYELLLGVVLQRVQTDGTQQTLKPAEAAGQMALTFQDQLPSFKMDRPVSIDAESVRAENDPYEYLYVVQLSLIRPPYLKLLAVLLVLLAASSAVFAVCMRPLQELVVGAGGVILGLWGIRSVLTPGSLGFVTAVDLALSAVILFMLGAIAARALWFVYQRSEIDLFRRRPRQ